MGAGLAEGPPCLPHSQILMGAGLAGRPPCPPHSQVLMGAGLARRPPPCLPQSGPYGCWVSWKTPPLSTTQSGPYGCWVSWENPDPPPSATQSGPYRCWVSWETSTSITNSKSPGKIMNPKNKNLYIDCCYSFCHCSEMHLPTTLFRWRITLMLFWRPI